MGQPTEAERVRGYILTQANKLTIPELVSKVRTDTAPLREAAASVPPARFFDRPASEDWSAAEVFTHILDMNDRGADAIQNILDGGGLPSTLTDLMTSGAAGAQPFADAVDTTFATLNGRRGLESDPSCAPLPRCWVGSHSSIADKRNALPVRVLHP